MNKIEPKIEKSLSKLTSVNTLTFRFFSVTSAPFDSSPKTLTITIIHFQLFEFLAFSNFKEFI